jgi:hypothetical protein
MTKVMKILKSGTIIWTRKEFIFHHGFYICTKFT